MAIRFKYKGGGDWLPGIPARDLTDEDELTKEQLKELAASVIYEAVKTDKAPAGEN